MEIPVQNGAGDTATNTRLLRPGYRDREGLAVGTAVALADGGTGTGAAVLAGDGITAVALGATVAGQPHPGAPTGLGAAVTLPLVGTGTAVAFPLVGTGTGVAFPPVGTAAGAATARLAVGVAVPFPGAAAVGVPVGAAGPGVAVCGPAGWLDPGVLGTVLAELDWADAV